MIAAHGAALAQSSPIDAPEDFTRALAAASRGDAQAALAIGDAYRLGRGVIADFPAAEGWYLRAAQAGNIRAAAELGLFYIDRHRPTDALAWLEQAARQGDAPATGALATLYVNGGGIAPDRPLAYALTARSAASGLAAAKAQLAALEARLSPAEIGAAADRLQRWESDTPTPLPVAAAAAASSSSQPSAPQWQVQIAAYRSVNSALRGWVVLSAQLKLASDVDPLLVHAGDVVRLRVPVADGDAARALCRAIIAKGGGCVPFRADGAAAYPAPPPVFAPS
jgi:hypothetical protein